MIISKTPFRVSFAGGGTDLREYYSNDYGAVISTAIDKYMYITVNKRFDDTIRVSYSKTEITDNVNKIKHPIVREVLKYLGIKGGVEITSVADIPSGTGLGSSSSFTVGLLHALYAYLGEYKSASELAADAIKIEVDILKEPIGKQDQYAAAYGGLRHYIFHNDETVSVEPVIMDKKTRERLNDNLLMFYVYQKRKAGSILKKQKSIIEEKKAFLTEMRDYSFKVRDIFANLSDFDELGEILDVSWKYKRSLVKGISNNFINECYDKAKKAGAIGGKILGAGGGGFLLLYCRKSKQNKLRRVLKHLKELDFNFEYEGSKIIYYGK